MSDAHPANGADTTRKAACKEVVNSGVEVEAQPLIHNGVVLGPTLDILNLLVVHARNESAHQPNADEEHARLVRRTKVCSNQRSAGTNHIYGHKTLYR